MARRGRILEWAGESWPRRVASLGADAGPLHARQERAAPPPADRRPGRPASCGGSSLCTATWSTRSSASSRRRHGAVAPPRPSTEYSRGSSQPSQRGKSMAGPVRAYADTVVGALGGPGDPALAELLAAADALDAALAAPATLDAALQRWRAAEEALRNRLLAYLLAEVP